MFFRKTRRAQALENSVRYVAEELERRMMLTTVTGVSSDLGDIRFLTGNGLAPVTNTFRAQVSGSASRLIFDLGGQTVEDSDGSDGWAASFNMSSLSVDSTLVVTAYQGAAALNSKSAAVRMTALPAWMNNAKFTDTFDSANGYTFDISTTDLDKGFDTPSNWQWTPPFFSAPLVNFANLHTGFNTGWHFTLISSPAGTVSVQDAGYHLHAQVIGQTVWDYTLSAGTNGNFKLGPAQGSYSISFNPTFNNNLTWIPGVSATATLNLTLVQTVPLATAHVSFGPSVPFVAELGAVDLGLAADVNIGLSGSLTAAITSSGPSLSNANIHPNVAVSLTGSADGSIGNILGFSAAKAGVDVTGTLKQDFSANYAGGNWTYDAPGSLNLSGTLHWDALFGLFSGSKDAFNWDMASWNFISPSGTLPDVATQPSTPSPTITSIAPDDFTGLPSSQRTPLVIRGTGFLPTSQVEWSTGGTVYPLKGASDANFLYVSATEIHYAISTGTNAADWHLRVVNPEVPPSAPVTFHVNAPANARPSASLYDPAVGDIVTAASINAAGHIDISFDAPGGLNTSTVTDADYEFSLVGSAAANVQIASSVPTALGNNRFRYAFSGNFTPGTVSINFIAGRWADNLGQLNEAAVQSFTVLPSGTDTTAPVITGVGSSAASTSALITWSTDEPATTQVEYDTNTTPYHSLYVKNTELVATHSITLPNLAPSTTYYFRIFSVDGSGNTTFTTNYSVTTLASGSVGLGSLQMNIAPQAAATIGAQWQIDGGNFQQSGALITGLSPGNHTIRFKTIGGWTTPADQTINVLPGQTVMGVGTYLQQSAVYTLQISADHGGVSRNPIASSYPAGTAVTLTPLPDIGYHFAGWSGSASGTQIPLTITMDSDKNITANWASGDLTHGTLQVSITPASAITAGADWSIDGGKTYYVGNSTLQGLSPGSYTIQFGALAGFAKPSNQTFSLSAGQTMQVTGAFVPDPQFGNVQVAIAPFDALAAGAQWRLDGSGDWQNGNTVLSNVPVGNHTIDFKPATGWVTPASQNIQVLLNQTVVVNGNYTPPSGVAILTSVFPSTAPLAGGTQIVIRGANFTSPVTVTVGGVAAPNVSIDSPTQITATVPAATTYGTAALVVTTPNGTVSSQNGFAYATSRGVNLEQSSQIGGISNAVFVQGIYAYVGEGAGLDVLDISNSSSPKLVGRVALPGLVNGVVAAGQYVYVADDDAGLEIVDVSNAAVPRVRGFYPTSGIASGIATLGGFVYLAAGTSGLEIFDVTNPGRPTLLGALATAGAANNVAINVGGAGVTAYVTDDDLQVINLNDPSNPVLAKTINTIDRSLALVLGGNYAYVSNYYHGIDIYSISSPLTPSLISNFGGNQWYQGLAYASGRIYAGYGLVTAFDVSNPTTPSLIPGSIVNSIGTNDLFISGTHLYAAGQGIQIVDISNPASIKLSGTYIGQSAQYYDVAASGSMVYAVTGSQFKVIDASNAGNPIERGSKSVVPANSFFQTVYYSGNRAYVAGSSLAVFDVTNPTAPTLLGISSSDSSGMYVNRVSVVGNTAYAVGQNASNGNPRFAILNVANPASISTIGSIDLGVNGAQSAVVVRGSLAYILGYTRGLQIVDISNASAPQLRGTLAPPDFDSQSIAISDDGNYVFIADGANGLRVVDVRNPDAPSLVSTIDVGSYARDVIVNDGLLYVAATSAGLKVFDVNDPVHPIQIASYDTPWTAWYIAVSDDYVYVAEGNAGLGILHRLDITPPTVTIINPTFNPTFATANGTVSIGGGASDNVGVTRVIWSNDRGGSGDATGTDNWLINAAVLQPGQNILTVTAIDSAGNQGTDSLTVTYNPIHQAQTITFPPLANRTYGDAPISLNATASSGLPVAYSVVSGPATLSGSILTITGAGSVVVRASQAGNAFYSAAPDSDQSFVVSMATQSITFGGLPQRAFGGDPFQVNPLATSGLPVSISVLSGPALVANNTVTITGTGTVVLRALQAGDANNFAAPSVDQAFTVTKADHSISFGALPGQLIGDAPFPLFATSNSGLPVSFSLISGQATLTGNILTLTGVAPVKIRASQAGNANYNAAIAVDRTFTVSVLLAADSNLDGNVNFADLVAVAQNYGSAGKVWAQGDFNGDGSVDFADLVAVAQNYGKSRVSAVASPAPDSVAAKSTPVAGPSLSPATSVPFRLANIANAKVGPGTRLSPAKEAPVVARPNLRVFATKPIKRQINDTLFN